MTRGARKTEVNRAEDNPGRLCLESQLPAVSGKLPYGIMGSIDENVSVIRGPARASNWPTQRVAAATSFSVARAIASYPSEGYSPAANRDSFLKKIFDPFKADSSKIPNLRTLNRVPFQRLGIV